MVAGLVGLPSLLLRLEMRRRAYLPRILTPIRSACPYMWNWRHEIFWVTHLRMKETDSTLERCPEIYHLHIGQNDGLNEAIKRYLELKPEFVLA
jgi:hypothetical protein